MEKQLIKDSEKIYSEKIYPTKFMFTDGMELKINHNELPGWILATESAKEVRWSVHMPVKLLLFFFVLLNIFVTYMLIYLLSIICRYQQTKWTFRV